MVHLASSTISLLQHKSCNLQWLSLTRVMFDGLRFLRPRERGPSWGHWGPLGQGVTFCPLPLLPSSPPLCCPQQNVPSQVTLLLSGISAPGAPPLRENSNPSSCWSPWLARGGHLVKCVPAEHTWAAWKNLWSSCWRSFPGMRGHVAGGPEATQAAASPLGGPFRFACTIDPAGAPHAQKPAQL